MSFEEAYLALRKREGRVYSDEVLAHLPQVPAGHPLEREWAIRRTSLVRLMGHLRGLNRPLEILDLGCGNGWMSKHLAHLPEARVLGADLGAVELEQAARVFATAENLRFQRLDIFEDDPGRFDVVVMGASVQYFSDLPHLVSRLRSLLNDGGQIHVFDSPFYSEQDVAGARARSEAYYTEHGFPELAAHYNHHAWAEMKGLGAELMYNPKTLFNWFWLRVLKRAETPFPWWMLLK